MLDVGYVDVVILVWKFGCVMLRMMKFTFKWVIAGSISNNDYGVNDMDENKNLWSLGVKIESFGEGIGEGFRMKMTRKYDL